jgi:prepilin-type N-terminal cleavage/methylation domain-containing protein
MKTLSPSHRSSSRLGFYSPPSRGFTLIELIMVMVILTAIMTVVSPSLNKFFRGTIINDEARRILGVTHLARHEAISSGMPMQVWFDLENQWFGVRELSGLNAGSGNPLNQSELSGPYVYQLDSSLEIELDRNSTITQSMSSIVYYPDGQLDIASLPGFYLKNKKLEEQKLQIIRAPNGLRYEIRKGDEMLVIQNDLLAQDQLMSY